jgi:hypothetical protein
VDFRIQEYTVFQAVADDGDDVENDDDENVSHYLNLTKFLPTLH